jgi:hypothetical protein
LGGGEIAEEYRVLGLHDNFEWAPRVRRWNPDGWKKLNFTNSITELAPIFSIR